MSLDVCLPDLERKGEIDVGRSREARELYAELRRHYERTHSPEAAAALASQKTVERLELAAAAQKGERDPPAQGATANAVLGSARTTARILRHRGRSIPRAAKLSARFRRPRRAQ
jgi:hypothetical protein